MLHTALLAFTMAGREVDWSLLHSGTAARIKYTVKMGINIERCIVVMFVLALVKLLHK